MQWIKKLLKRKNISVSEVPATTVPETTAASSQAQSITQGTGNNKSSWRSWWTRSAANSVGNSTGNSIGIVFLSNASDPVPVPGAVTNTAAPSTIIASNSNSTTPSSPLLLHLSQCWLYLLSLTLTLLNHPQNWLNLLLPFHANWSECQSKEQQWKHHSWITDKADNSEDSVTC